MKRRSVYSTEEEWAEPIEHVEGGPAFRPITEITSPLVDELGAASEIDPHTESPIETLLGAALKLALPKGTMLVPQYPLDRFRFDFGILGPQFDLLALIECDGRAFHSSAEQIASDRAKDDVAAKAGAVMMRFTGSQIVSQRKECIANVLRDLERRR